jgi:hypothetical protein
MPVIDCRNAPLWWCWTAWLTFAVEWCSRSGNLPSDFYAQPVGDDFARSLGRLFIDLTGGGQ